MLDGAMPCTAQKRRVIYVSDQLWSKVLSLACKEKISSSSALRILLEENEE